MAPVDNETSWCYFCQVRPATRTKLILPHLAARVCEVDHYLPLQGFPWWTADISEEMKLELDRPVKLDREPS